MSDMDKVAEAGAVIRRAMANEKLFARELISAAAALEGIYNLIQEQVDAKIHAKMRGWRVACNWSAIIPTISDQAVSAKLAIEEVLEQTKGAE